VSFQCNNYDHLKNHKANKFLIIKIIEMNIVMT